MSGGWNLIDRDPNEMLSCAKSIKTSVENLSSTLVQTINKIKGYSSELDTDCQNSIVTLQETIKEIQGQLDEYTRLAVMLEKNANYILNRPKL